MEFRRLILAAAFAAALPAVGCGGGPDADRPSAEALARLTPAERGVLRAGRDVAAGRLRLFRYGNPVDPRNPRTDAETGLPVRTLLDCCVTGAARAETEAYNRAMREAAATRETPSALGAPSR